MRRELIMARTRGLSGPLFGKISGRRLMHTPGNFLSGPGAGGLGPELHLNGGFGSDTIWLKQAGWTIVGGVAVGAPGATSVIDQDAGLVIGKTYEVTWTLVTRLNDSVRMRCGTTLGASQFVPGTFTEQIVCAGNSLFAARKGSLFDGTIDNISCKEVL